MELQYQISLSIIFVKGSLLLIYSKLISFMNTMNNDPCQWQLIGQITSHVKMQIQTKPLIFNASAMFVPLKHK